MTKLFKISLLGLLISCCGFDPNFYWIEDDGRFWRYRAFFEKHTGHDTGYIPIMYGEESAVASCRSRIWPNNSKWHQKHIVVNRLKFDRLSVNWRRAIIAHELIHCHLEVDYHIEDPEAETLQLMAALLPVDWPLTTIELIQALEEWK